LPRRFAGHAYLLHGYSPRKLISDGVLLIGDSAGLAYEQSGEGIRPAIESGLIAARLLQMAGGDYSGARLAHYPALLRQRFGGDGRAERLAKRLPRVVRSLAGRILLRNAHFCRTMVVENWFLRMNDPPLVVPSVHRPEPARLAV
jgi:flavin-dependent dehydrogenase